MIEDIVTEIRKQMKLPGGIPDHQVLRVLREYLNFDYTGDRHKDILKSKRQRWLKKLFESYKGDYVDPVTTPNVFFMIDEMFSRYDQYHREGSMILYEKIIKPFDDTRYYGVEKNG